MSTTLEYLQLQAAKGIGAARQRSILTYLYQENITLAEFAEAEDRDWKSLGIPLSLRSSLSEAESVAREWRSIISRQKIRIVSFLDDDYPARLRKTLGGAAAPILHMWGNAGLLEQLAVGFCGARDASDQGVAFTNDAARQVAKMESVVVAGHARGVDFAAHLAALEERRATIFVVPAGLFNFQLHPELKAIMDREQILIISEFQPDAQWSIGNAMTRNKTICGLSHALVVVESGLTGGTYEAGKFALKAKVPLFVAAYAEPEPSAAGNSEFLEKGALPIAWPPEHGQADLTELFRTVEEREERLANEASPAPPKKPPKKPSQRALPF